MLFSQHIMKWLSWLSNLYIYIYIYKLYIYIIYKLYIIYIIYINIIYINYLSLYINISFCLYIYNIYICIYIHMYIYSICTPISQTRTQGGIETMRRYLETRSDKSISSNSLCDLASIN